MQLEWYQIIIILFGSGVIGSLATLVWKASKRDSKIDDTSLGLKENKEKIVAMGRRADEYEEYVDKKIDDSNLKINMIERDLVELKVNQKNLIHSINAQNKQVLDLIDRLEKNQVGFMNIQRDINEKLESGIDSIKNTLIHSSHSHCIFYNKGIREIKEIIGVKTSIPKEDS